jgi:hypothetical protein
VPPTPTLAPQPTIAPTTQSIQPVATTPAAAKGYPVRCKDGTISQSGGIQGACSHHGGEIK